MNCRRFGSQRSRWGMCAIVAAALCVAGRELPAATIIATGDSSIHYYPQDWDPSANGGLGGPTVQNTAPAAVDGRIDDRWAISASSTTSGNFVGTAGSVNVSRHAAVHELLFALPARPAGYTVDVTSSLAVWLTSRMGVPTFNVDAWGLGYKAAATFSTNDFQDVDGDNDPGTGGALSAHTPQRREVQFSDAIDLGAAYGIAGRVKVLDNLLTTSSALNAYSTGSGASLTTYLNAIYDAGAMAGDYVVFRLNSDVGLTPTSVNLRYNLGTKETATGDAQAAILTIDFAQVVPEPASLTLLAGFALAMSVCRVVRRRS